MSTVSGVPAWLLPVKSQKNLKSKNKKLQKASERDTGEYSEPRRTRDRLARCFLCVYSLNQHLASLREHLLDTQLLSLFCTSSEHTHILRPSKCTCLVPVYYCTSCIPLERIYLGTDTLGIVVRCGLYSVLKMVLMLICRRRI